MLKRVVPWSAMGVNATGDKTHDFNDRAWASPEMEEANRAVEAAWVELSAKGWGLIALDQAQARLAHAIRLIEAMKQFETVVIANPVTVSYTQNGRIHA